MRKLLSPSYVLAGLLLIVTSTSLGQRSFWTRALRDQDRNQSEKAIKGSFLLAKALESIDESEYEAVYTNLVRIAQHGWYETSDRVELFLLEHREAASLAAQASYDQNLTLPPILSPEDPLPRADRFDALVLIMTVWARRWEVDGDYQRAALTATQILAIGEVFRTQEDQPESVATIGRETQNTVLPLLRSLVGKADIQAAELRLIGKALDSLDFSPETVSRPVIKNIPGSMMEVQARANALIDDPSLGSQLSAIDPGRLAVYKAFVAVDQGVEAEALIGRLAGEISEMYARPFHERVRLGQAWFMERIPDPILAEVFATQLPSQEFLIRSEVLRSQISLLKITTGFRLGIRDLYKTEIDPFSGTTFRSGASRLYSIGPDGLDQSGNVEYQASRGLYSNGDIVLRLQRPTP